MNTIKRERLEEVLDYAEKHGKEKCVSHFGISYETISRYDRFLRSMNPRPPKILVFDIENAPLEAYVWNKRVWNTSISPDHVKEEWFMISWAAKWLLDSEIQSNVLTSREAKKKDDTRLVKNLWKLFDEADIIIAHNAHNFDIPMANTKFILNGLMPPSPYRMIDTLQVARKSFSFTYNKLDYLGKMLGIGNKIHTDFQLWIDCMKGDEKALQEMLTYNIQDVNLLEEVYIKLRPWVKSHPNLNIIRGTEMCCPACGSESIQSRGEYLTLVHAYESFQCDECGSYSRKTKHSVTSLAR